ncbi:MAG: type III polyketide synthase [Bacteroidetes bacterium]|nr:type III polyketide synthase [Bacteroidota bacterium]
MSTIISIGTAVPQHGARQSTILEFMRNAYHDDTASRKLNILFHNSGINTRYSVVPDFGNKQSGKSFFDVNLPVPGVEERLKVFKENASSLAIKAMNNAFQRLNTSLSDFKITHLITVTCTGIYAPGIGAALIEELELPEDIFHTAINFMGCNAAFPALNLANMITQTDENAKVLIVCVELCTLHFHAVDNSDNLLANTIFGDGAAAVLVVSDSAAKKNHLAGLCIKGFFSLLLYKGRQLMGWNITPVNFEMVLNTGIPEFIGSEVKDILHKAGEKFNITQSAIDKWAIHPGGKKILDSVRQELQLGDTEMQFSYKVLADYGNMSSPTILFVLREIMDSVQKEGESIFSIGFGPGLSIETALLVFEANALGKPKLEEYVSKENTINHLSNKPEEVSIL